MGSADRKKCSGPCGRTLSLDNFQKDRTQPDGRKYRCKACQPKKGRRVESVAPKASLDPKKWQNTLRELEGIDVEPPRVDPDVMTYITDTVKKAAPKPVEESVTPVEEHRLKRRIKELETLNKALVRDLSDAQLIGDIVREAEDIESEGIRPRTDIPKGRREGTALAMASDWHIEEEIRPEQVSNSNRYNLEISRRRMERFFESVLWAIESQRNTFVIRDLILWLGGDLITNYLHEDNVLTNLLAPPEALAYAQASISDGIRFLLKDKGLERIVIPCNDGNHGRMSKRMGSSSRTMMSLEIMLYRMLAREFKDEPRVQFLIAEGEHLYYEVYGRTIRFVHGDSIKYSAGVGGITIPIMKAINAWNTMRYADLTCMGHWHQRLVLPDLMVNGSLIGYGPFSMTIRARFEPPSQNFSILEPKRFRSVDLPLWVSERDDDQHQR